MKYFAVVMVSSLLLVGCSKDKPETQSPEAETKETAKSATEEPGATPSEAASTVSTIYQAPIRRLGEDQPVDLSEYRGKALLVVNVASRCGFTNQYEGLEAMYEKYKDRGLVVLGFPCNQFGGQEPGSAEDIKSFCRSNYGVKFPMYEKIEVNGANRHPIYAELSKVADGEGDAGDVKWNFEKFVVSADGKTVKRFRSRTKPEDPDLVSAVEAALP
jgi:glutathione peroxidase